MIKHIHVVLVIEGDNNEYPDSWVLDEENNPVSDEENNILIVDEDD